MITIEHHIRFCGVLMVALSLAHTAFPAYFRWAEELRVVSLINRQMMYVHTFFVAFTVFLMGLLCLTSAEELAGPGLGERLAVGLSVFWFCRLVIQFFGFSSNLWRGKQRETTVHVLASLLWTYFTTVFVVCFIH